MTKEEKNKIIDSLVGSFNACSNFYITDIATLNSEKTSKLRRLCFTRNITLNVAKNTLIVKALQQLGNDKYNGLMDAFHGVTALMFSDSPKEPALLNSSIRKEYNIEKPLLKAALIGDDIFMGNDSLKALKNIKTKNELIGEVIGLLKSPLSRVLSALQNRPETATAE